MFKWIIFTSVLISGSALAYLYVNVKALENDPSALPPVEKVDTLHMLHSYKNGFHHYIGSLRLPNSCHKVEAVILRDPKILDKFDMRITTTDLQATTAFCSQLPSRYQFAVDEEGPEQVTLTVQLNGKSRPYELREVTTAATDLGTQQ